MPAEFSLVVTARPLPPLDRLVPAEDCIKVCATRPLPVQTRYLPFSGTVRADNLPLLPYLPPMDVSTTLLSCLHSSFGLDGVPQSGMLGWDFLTS